MIIIIKIKYKMQLDILYNIALHCDFKTITSLICTHQSHTLNDYFWQNKYHIDNLAVESPTILKLYQMSTKEKYVKAILLTKEIERILKFPEYQIEFGNRDRIINYFKGTYFSKLTIHYNHCQLRLFNNLKIMSLSYKDIYGHHCPNIAMPHDIKQLLFNVLY